MTGAAITIKDANTLSVNGILYVIPGTTSKIVGPGTSFLQPTAAGGELVLACDNPTNCGALQIEAVVQNNTSASSVTKEGTGIVTLKASGGNTYSGVTKINTGTLKLVSSTLTNNIANSPLIDLAAGATLDISGMTDANQFVLANGQTLKGSGTVTGVFWNKDGKVPYASANMTVGNGSTLSPGNSTGTLTVVDAKETWAGGGTYAWQLLNTTGEAGTDWDLTAVTNGLGVTSNLAVTATAGSKFNIALQTLSGIAPDVQGTAGDWTANDPHSWKIASSAGAITGWDVDDDAASDLFNIDTTNFVGAGTGSSFNVSKTGNDVFLNYVPSSGPIVVLGDTNEDGVVDAADYIAIKTNFGLTGTGITKFQGDLIDNDIVDWADLQELMAHFGDTSGAPAAMTMNNTPEPATLGLLAIGALAVIRRRQGYGGQVRRRRARA
jgi:autotransporter-associated beta strand protein